MSHIESLALTDLRNKGIDPPIYKRYVDDCIMGPIQDENSLHNTILTTFNNVNSRIQFTIEIVHHNHFLAFLDLELKVSESGVIEHRWYRKKMHSGHTIDADSIQTVSCKTNNLITTFHRIASHSSNDNNYKEGADVATQTFLAAGYSLPHIQRAELKAKSDKQTSKKWTDDNKVILKLPFVNPVIERKVRTEVIKSGLPIKIVFTPGPKLIQKISPKLFRQSNICSCEICNQLTKFSCTTCNVVYQFTCNICHNTYIGKTTRTMKDRYNEHKRAILNKSKSSALFEHLNVKHQGTGLVCNISCFSLQIVAKAKDPIDTALMEAKLIKSCKPAINRKHELASF
jgi:hypothetical protein